MTARAHINAARQPCGAGEHVIFIAAHFAPESTSGTHRSLHFARALHDEGFFVSVVTVDRESLETSDPRLETVFPYESRIARVARRPTLDALYVSGKRRLLSLRSRGGDDGNPAPAGEHAEAADKAARRYSIRNEIGSLLAFPDRYRGWYYPALRAGLRFAEEAPVRAVFASGPPWTSLRVAAELARRLRCPLITDFRDPWTSSMGVADFDSRVHRMLAERDEARIVRASDYILFNSPALMESARGTYPGEVERFRTILNGTDLPARADEHPFPAGEPPVVRHFGSLYGGRSIEALIAALAACGAERARIELVGPTVSNTHTARESAQNAGVPLECVPTLPYSEAAQLMAQPALLLVVQGRDFGAQIPTKLYEYLRTGNPVLVLASKDSMVWHVAARFARCHRLDFSDSAHNEAVMRRLLDEARSGTLRQVAAHEDTASLSKRVIGLEFADVIRCALDTAPRRAQSSASPESAQQGRRRGSPTLLR